MASFRAALDRAPAAVKMSSIVPPPGASTGGALPGNLQSSLEVARQIQMQANLARLVAQYQISAAARRQLQAALVRFKAHDRLSDAERTTLVRQMRGVLNEQERDDLRAALERRPIIKQQGLVAGLIPNQRPVAVPAPPAFKVQDLVLRQ